MNKILILILSLLALSLTQKVKVDLYLQSLCPDCQAFVASSLKTAASTTDFWKICDFNLYPYGNARRAQNGSQWSFTCQHGVRQCEGNIIQTCAIRLYDFYTQALPFIICIEGNSANWTQGGQRCATQLSLDWNRIQSCSTSAQGNQWEYQMAVATESLRPAHTYVPWIVVNGAHSTTTQTQIINNMVRTVCNLYKGTVKIDACL